MLGERTPLRRLEVGYLANEDGDNLREERVRERQTTRLGDRGAAFLCCLRVSQLLQGLACEPGQEEVWREGEREGERGGGKVV